MNKCLVKQLKMKYVAVLFALLLSGCVAFKLPQEDDFDLQLEALKQKWMEYEEQHGNELSNEEHEEKSIFDTNSDVGLRVPELVAKYGYPIESYTVETSDGYFLTVHRIPHGKDQKLNEVNKKVIFLQHGLLCSSSDWVIMGPEKGLAYLLADMGYDVWMGNARGNTYSRHNRNYDPDIQREKFWDFSWHEIGSIDLPAMIDFVLAKTGQEKLYYVGHSQGTTAFFVMASEHPEYNEKIKLMVALAPVAFMESLPNILLKLVATMHKILSWIMSWLGQFELLPSSKLIKFVSALMCHPSSDLKGICQNILFLIAGYDEPQLNKTMVPVILSNTPAGASTKQILHYAQLTTSKNFQQYDYGSSQKNRDHYGPEFSKPPKYDLSKVTAPVALYHGANDLLSSEKDVMHLHQSLGHSILNSLVPYKKWSHLDFLWGIDVVTFLYNDVFEILSRY